MTTTKTSPMLPFPICWPSSWPRTSSADRQRSQFGTGHVGDVSLGDARAFALDQLARLGATDVVITSDLPTRREDLGRATGNDPGIAAWFTLRGESRVLACDKWQSHAENLRAVGLTVEAMRGLERWGAGDVVERAFAGFAALPPGGVATEITGKAAAPRQVAIVPGWWRKALGAEAAGDSLEAVRACYRRAIRLAHPDLGGNEARAMRINKAWDAAQAELGEEWPTIVVAGRVA